MLLDQVLRRYPVQMHGALVKFLDAPAMCDAEIEPGLLLHAHMPAEVSELDQRGARLPGTRSEPNDPTHQATNISVRSVEPPERETRGSQTKRLRVNQLAAAGRFPVSACSK